MLVLASKKSAALQMWDVPSAWSLKDAATVPVAYMTAYYALLIRGALQRHHTVLVHSGTGAVGMAAIRICHHRGCEVSVFRCIIPLSDPHQTLTGTTSLICSRDCNPALMPCMRLPPKAIRICHHRGCEVRVSRGVRAA